MSPRELVAAARSMVDTPTAGTLGWWPRGAAVVCRQALEGCVATTLTGKGADVRDVPFTAQLVVLPVVIEPELAGRVRETWVGLSAATHVHAYELPPTAAEMRQWLDVVAELVDAL